MSLSDWYCILVILFDETRQWVCARKSVTDFIKLSEVRPVHMVVYTVLNMATNGQQSIVLTVLYCVTTLSLRQGSVNN